MALFVDSLSHTEQLKDVVAYIRALTVARDGAESDDAVASKFAQLVADAATKSAEVLEFVISQGSLSFSHGSSESEVEIFWLAVYNIARQVGDLERFLNEIVKQIVGTVDDKNALRLQVIASLYNVVGTPNSRTHLLRALLQFAADSKQTDLVYKHFASIDSWLDEWNASSQDRREIYKIVYDQLVAIGKDDIETFNVLRKHLANFEDADGAALATSRDSAVAAAVQAIRLPDVHQCDDLLELKAVQQLKSDPEHSKLFELLSLFATDKLDAFKTFVAGNPGYLEHIGLSHTDGLKKIRLLSLATLAAENPVLPYSLIATTLDIPQDDVEDWVVIAISAGVLEAKMNELKQVVIVQRCTQRVFERAQWELLKTKISGWHENIHALLSTLRTASQHHHNGR